MFTNVYRSLRKPVRRGALLSSALLLFGVTVPLAAYHPAFESLARPKTLRCKPIGDGSP